jgi:hypothetical protein
VIFLEEDTKKIINVLLIKNFKDSWNLFLTNLQSFREFTNGFPAKKFLSTKNISDMQKILEEIKETCDDIINNFIDIRDL